MTETTTSSSRAGGSKFLIAFSFLGNAYQSTGLSPKEALHHSQTKIISDLPSESSYPQGALDTETGSARHIDEQNLVEDFLSDLIQNQVELPADAKKIMEENIWDLM